MSKSRLPETTLVLLTIGILLVPLQGNAGATFPGRNGRIAYVDFDGSGATDQEIYTIRPDGSSAKRLTRNRRGDTDPQWSASGTRLVYRCRAPFGERATQKSGEICTMDAHGDNRRRLTHNQVADTSPSWSPNGRWIVFVRIFQLGPGKFQWDIFKMRADGSRVTRLTRTRAYDDHPEWSPDGKRIAFVSNRPGNQDIFSMRSNGKRRKNLTRSEEGETYPSWSPNGRRIVFSRYLGSVISEEGWQLFKMHRNGSGEVRLTTDSSGTDLAAVFSPDGDKIAFTRDDDLWVMRADGSHQRRLTGGEGSGQNYEVAPDWRPRP